MTGPLRPGDPWGHAASGPPDLEVAGDDADIANVAMSDRGALVRFRPSPRSDIARALGLGPTSTGATEVAIDALEVEPDDGALNAVVLGAPPDRLRWSARASDITVRVDGRPWFRGRATTVVVASGQFLRGADVVPRGHPGDGWAEVQVYALTRRARRPMRRRLPAGTHVPHPGIRTGRARRVEVAVAGRGLTVELDGRPRGRTTRLEVTLVPSAIRLLV
ncbi:MAG TPA: hypothetical protein VHY55_08390 [Acidimicrobiia bacterium]|nr:hypothetical protein [Acidimicrobiia bacterium]